MLMAASAGGWDPPTLVTAVLAGIAATAGLAAIVMNWVMQRDQQHWQEVQENERRDWEQQQEQERRDWQEEQRISTRWDDFKRRLYADFLAAADLLFAVTDELGDVRRGLAEDLANHMAMVEEYYQESESERLNSMSTDERQQFWQDKYEEQREWFQERRKDLSAKQHEVKEVLGRSIVELELMAPTGIRKQIRDLARLSEQTHFGSYQRDQERQAVRGQFIEAVRNDLQVPSK